LINFPTKLDISDKKAAEISDFLGSLPEFSRKVILGFWIAHQSTKNHKLIQPSKLKNDHFKQQSLS